MIQQSVVESVESVESLEECEVAEGLACEEQGSCEELGQSDVEARDLATGDFEVEPVDDREVPEGEPEASAEYTTQEQQDAAAEPVQHSTSKEADDAIYLNQIRQAEYAIQGAESAYLQAKEDAKEAKDYLDAKVAELRKIIRQGSVDLPLFNQDLDIGDQLPSGAAVTDVSYSSETQQVTVTIEKAANDAAPDESWRTVSLIEAGVPIKIYDLLAEHTTPILTVGDLADFTSGEHNRLTSIKGIGAGKAEKIEAAMEKFWASR